MFDPERDRLREILDKKFGPREPVVRIYRLEHDGSQSRVDSDTRGNIRARFGPGKFLIRTILPNGTFGPSRVVSIGTKYLL